VIRDVYVTDDKRDEQSGLSFDQTTAATPPAASMPRNDREFGSRDDAVPSHRRQQKE
jgi:hypothetical protein